MASVMRIAKRISEANREAANRETAKKERAPKDPVFPDHPNRQPC
jgi:hypothetical protein